MVGYCAIDLSKEKESDRSDGPIEGGMSKKSTPPTDWREARRMRAWELHEAGWKQKDIAEALGVSEGAVSQWFKKARIQGAQALKHQPPPGATPKLTREQLAQLPEELAKGAEAFGFRGQVWTAARVAAMMKHVFWVSYHPAHCRRLLRALKQRRQKTIEKASQHDETAIAAWKAEQWPARKKGCARKTDDRLCRSVGFFSLADACADLCTGRPDAHLESGVDTRSPFGDGCYHHQRKDHHALPGLRLQRPRCGSLFAVAHGVRFLAS